MPSIYSQVCHARLLPWFMLAVVVENQMISDMFGVNPCAACVCPFRKLAIHSQRPCGLLYEVSIAACMSYALVPSHQLHPCHQHRFIYVTEIILLEKLLPGLC